MTKFAASSQMFSSNALQLGGGSGGGGGGSKISTSTLKRKTPSELRGELLYRSFLMNLQPQFLVPRVGGLSGSKKSDSSKAPRYIDTGMDEPFPVTKNYVTLKLLSRNKNIKETVCNDYVGSLKTSIVPMDSNGNHQAQNSWLHRLTNCGSSNGLSQFTSVGCTSQSTGYTSQPASNCQSSNPRTSHSWVHPQSILPHSVMAALTSAPGGKMDLLCNRQRAWEDSFRCLYYMLRKKLCKIFYGATLF